MKKGVRRAKLFNVFSLILLGVLFVEIIVLIDQGVVGNSVKSVNYN